MNDADKTKGQLITELVELRKQLEELRESKADRKQAEEALSAAVIKAKEEKSKTEAIIAAMGDGVSIQDTNYKILYQNQVFKNNYGDHIGEYCYRALWERITLRVWLYNAKMLTFRTTVRFGQDSSRLGEPSALT
jgi:PAS domain-containing protein